MPNRKRRRWQIRSRDCRCPLTGPSLIICRWSIPLPQVGENRAVCMPAPLWAGSGEFLQCSWRLDVTGANIGKSALRQLVDIAASRVSAVNSEQLSDRFQGKAKSKATRDESKTVEMFPMESHVALKAPASTRWRHESGGHVISDNLHIDADQLLTQ